MMQCVYQNEQLRSRAIINYYKVVEGEIEFDRYKIIEAKKNEFIYK